MKSLILREILTPLITRGGTALTGYLVGAFGVEHAMANEFGLAVAGVLLVGMDLVLSGLARRNQIKRAENRLLDDMWRSQM